MGYSGAIIKGKDEKILFQLRDKYGRNPNTWGIFGGGINKGEKAEEALKRELKEELGLKKKDYSIIKKTKIPLINYNLYEVKLNKIPQKSDLKEGKGMKFMKKKEFMGLKNALFRVKMFFILFSRD